MLELMKRIFFCSDHEETKDVDMDTGKHNELDERKFTPSPKKTD